MLRGGNPGAGEAGPPLPTSGETRIHWEDRLHEVGWSGQLRSLSLAKKAMFDRGAPGDLIDALDSIGNWMMAIEHYLRDTQ